MKLTLDELRKTKVGSLPINSHLHPLGALQNPEPQPDPVRALDQSPPARRRRKRSVVVVVTIISLRHRLLDEDNLIGGAKPVRDCVSTSLGIDDGDRRIVWEYRQQQTNGIEGTIVQISTNENAR